MGLQILSQTDNLNIAGYIATIESNSLIISYDLKSIAVFLHAKSTTVKG